MSEGVVYKDRKKRAREEENEKRLVTKKMEARIEENVKKIKKEIKKAMKFKRITDIQEIYNKVTSFPKDNFEAEKAY